MKKFTFKKIQYKILFGFILLFVLVLLLNSVTSFTLLKSNEQTEKLINQELEHFTVSKELEKDHSMRTNFLQSYLLYGDQTSKDLFYSLEEKTLQLEAKLLQLNNGDEATTKLISLKKDWSEMSELMFEYYDSGNVDQANDVMVSGITPISQQIVMDLQDRALKQESLMKEMGADTVKAGSSTFMTSVILTIVMIIVGVVIAILTSQSITRPIKLVMDRMKAIASGDISKEPLPVKTKDETGQLIASTNVMASNMQQMLRKIGEVSVTVAKQGEELAAAALETKTGATQITATMQEMAGGSEVQANSAAELASVMGIFSERVSEANEKGDRVHDYSTSVLSMTSTGSQMMDESKEQMETINELVKDAVLKMEGLDAETQEITQLVSVIQDVAAQTNLLALNAAIEAARAGEQGKGFAVVADEVRKLAEQVSSSVTDITEIVTKIQTESNMVAKSLKGGYAEVEKGTEQIAETGNTLNEITSSVTRMVADITEVSENLTTLAANTQQMNNSIEEIASVSEEAAAGMQQVVATTEQAGASMDQIAASTDELTKLAEELNGLVKQFKI
ncbi:methyl-accepting chemotaxis protein [Chungangia koreensis]|uniref:Methyl-accepting chemotaxis protein n=1 Tax=Chungangia koreensis TaxID=752657 RepID=A0ABV8X8A3_9LACT